MTISENGVSSIGISQTLLVDHHHPSVWVPYLEKKMLFTMLAIAAVAGVVFAAIGCTSLSILSLGALTVSAGAAFFIKNRTPPFLEKMKTDLEKAKTEVEYKKTLENFVEGALYSVPSFPGDLCEDLGRGIKKSQIFMDLFREGCLIKTREKEFVLAPEKTHKFEGLETVDLGNEDSFLDKLRDLLVSNGITNEDEQKKIIYSLYQGIASDLFEALFPLFKNEQLDIFLRQYSLSNKKTPRFCLDLTTKGVAQITFRSPNEIFNIGKERRLAIVNGLITISDHRDGKNSYTFSITKPPQD